MISTTAACGWLPRAPFLDGPLDRSAAPPLRRKTGGVHPTYRTAEGKAVRGEVAPDGPHYVHRERDRIDSIYDLGGYYEWAPCLGPEVDHTCTTCGLTEDTTTCHGLFFNYKGQMGCEEARCETTR